MKNFLDTRHGLQSAEFFKFHFSLSFQLPRLTAYVRFCSCQLKACQLLQTKAETNPEFKQFEKVITSQASSLLKLNMLVTVSFHCCYIFHEII